MIEKLTPHRITLTYEACLNSFWRKKRLRTFLRECGISESFLATWNEDESKREFLDRTFGELQKGERGRQALLKMGVHLSEQESFPDLEHWEDSKEKIQEASTAVSRLQTYIRKQEEELASLTDREQAGATDIDSFLKKVNDKADNTMGIMISISGYSKVAKNEASGPETPLLLIDHSHLYMMLSNVMKCSDVIEAN